MILGSLNSYFRSRSDRTPSDNDGLHPPQPDRGLPWRGILLGLAVAIVPLVTSCGVYWLKFHALIPSTLLDQQVSGPGASSYWLALRRVDHNSLAGLRFIPTDLLAYLRPDGLRLHSGLPFIDFRLGVTAGVQYVGIPPGSILAEPWSTVPDEMPLAVILVLAAGVYWARRQLGRGLRLRPALWALLASPMAYCIAAGLGACVVTLTQCGITGRYLGDGVPLIVILVAASARVLGPAIASLSGRRATVLVAGVTVLLVASLLINVGLEYQDWWHTVP
jgi:hypothetical protein